MVWDPKSAVFGWTHWYHIFQPCQDHVWNKLRIFWRCVQFRATCNDPWWVYESKNNEDKSQLETEALRKAAGQTGNMKDGRGDIRSSENQQIEDKTCVEYICIYIYYMTMLIGRLKKNPKNWKVSAVQAKAMIFHIRCCFLKMTGGHSPPMVVGSTQPFCGRVQRRCVLLAIDWCIAAIAFFSHTVIDLIWVCLKMGYTPNYSHLVGIMIINHWV